MYSIMQDTKLPAVSFEDYEACLKMEIGLIEIQINESLPYRILTISVKRFMGYMEKHRYARM
jgi:hypothetical protein